MKLKIKFLNWLLIIDILTLFLVLGIALIPSSVIRIVIGLPFLLFFPGYVLVAALFPLQNSKVISTQNESSSNTEFTTKQGNKKSIDGIERIALSFGMSIAVVALIGLGLNYTSWGIRLVPVLIAISAFVIIMSIVALLRAYGSLKGVQLTMDLHVKMPGWNGSPFNKALTVILAVAIMGTVGVLAYTVIAPKVGEKFSEFYILGSNGKAESYPAVFYLNGNRVVGVQYGDNATTNEDTLGQITVGIINQEQKNSIYTVAINIDGQPADINFNGNTLPRLEQIELVQGGKWEQKIGFAPLYAGDNQKVEFELFKDGQAEPENSLHLWVNVRQQ
jgi:uncharacterized membrane protein